MGLDSDRLSQSHDKFTVSVANALCIVRVFQIVVAVTESEASIGTDAFFNTGVEADMMDSDKNAMYWSQGGLGLGDRVFVLLYVIKLYYLWKPDFICLTMP